MMEASQHRFNAPAVHGECGFKIIMPAVMHFKKVNEVKQVCAAKSAVFKFKQSLQFLWGMINTKIIRRHSHQLHQLFGLLYDRGAISPCEDSCKESRDLYVLFF